MLFRSIFGALLGAGLFSTLGIGAAYGAVVGLYLASVLLAWRITPIPRQPTENSRPWTDLKLGFSYIRRNETIVAIMALAFLANFTGFPMIRGLLPALARDVYAMDETGLAQLIALLAIGALLGSLATATVLRVTKPARMMVIWLVIWHLFILLLGLFSIPMHGNRVGISFYTNNSHRTHPYSYLIASDVGDPLRLVCSYVCY